MKTESTYLVVSNSFDAWVGKVTHSVWTDEDKAWEEAKRLASDATKYNRASYSVETFNANVIGGFVSTRGNMLPARPTAPYERF